MIRELAAFERSLDEVESTEELLHAALFADDPAVWATMVERVDDSGGVEVAGFALWFRNFFTWTAKHSIYLDDLYVRPQFRGRGYGKALLKSLVATCVERGYPRLDWWVLDWNDSAIEFYRSIGAVAKDDWTVWRLTGDALRAFSEAPERPEAP
jgi:GNAT superfamily N-acetyltransferase